MEPLWGIFRGIDISDSKVQTLFVALIFGIFLIVLAVFFVCRLFISRSKVQDVEAIDKAIRRLKRLILLDKIALCADALLIVLLGLLHSMSVIDVLCAPFLWIAMVAVAVAPLLMVAVFGIRASKSSNRQKLDDLCQMRNKLPK